KSLTDILRASQVKESTDRSILNVRIIIDSNVVNVQVLKDIRPFAKQLGQQAIEPVRNCLGGLRPARRRPSGNGPVDTVGGRAQIGECFHLLQNAGAAGAMAEDEAVLSGGRAATVVEKCVAHSSAGAAVEESRTAVVVEVDAGPAVALRHRLGRPV